MPAEILPLIDLHKPLALALIPEFKSALRQYGAFRLVAPQSTRYRRGDVFQNARIFFQQSIDAKNRVKEYSPYASERVRGRTVFPKESMYFFRHGEEPGYTEYPSPDFYRSVKTLHEEWTPIKSHLLKLISETLDSSTPLTGTALLDSATLGVHYYDPQALQGSIYFSPPHMDSGTLTILLRSPVEDDGLEIADLQTTRKRDSEGIGSEASFISVPTSPDEYPEVIVFAGTRLQRLFGSDQVRACVHRYCNFLRSFGAIYTALSITGFLGILSNLLLFLQINLNEVASSSCPEWRFNIVKGTSE